MANFVERLVQRFQKILSEPGMINDMLTMAESNTGVDRIYIAPGAVGFLAVYLVVGFGAQLVCNFIGFVYPAYASIKAIETKQKDDDTRVIERTLYDSDDTKWLTYWVVYACFGMVEFFSDILLSWFPLYWLGKCTFLVFCFAPTTWNGSTIIYQSIIRPVFLTYESDIDQAATNFRKEADQAAAKFSKALKPTLAASVQAFNDTTSDNYF
ncbi:hypothetical protein GHT06_016750 [Daphnia sinensis]|uniref:Receptor expression-enhancing protein n=1 Tax=Daphnia sinensis TaxID=1820382 RepID=A0AAD5KNU4_9CRUS|nr:hypothetical protein GHT06_016750 [Daphnia sinensis]